MSQSSPNCLFLREKDVSNIECRVSQLHRIIESKFFCRLLMRKTGPGCSASLSLGGRRSTKLHIRFQHFRAEKASLSQLRVVNFWDPYNVGYVIHYYSKVFLLQIVYTSPHQCGYESWACQSAPGGSSRRRLSCVGFQMFLLRSSRPRPSCQVQLV